MLSDEEKKALKVVNKRTERLIEELKIEEEDLIDEPKIAYLITQIESNKTLVNLIAKQSKEIEEAEQKEKKAYIDGTNVAHELCNKYWEDKIKAKVIEVKDRAVKDEFITASQGKLNTVIDMESLLEKE